MCIETEQRKKPLIKGLSTPCFVVRIKELDGLIDDLIHTSENLFQDPIIGYSFKTNNLPWVISHVKQSGLWAEVVSSDEYNLAIELGFSEKNIIFNGPVKGKKEFIKAVENGSIVNIDSFVELEWLKEIDRHVLQNSRLGLRVNFCVEDKCPGESQCGEEDGRFGFSIETGDLAEAIAFFTQNNIPLSGLHLHVSSKTRSLNIYKCIAEIAVIVAEKHQLFLKYVDIGGGFFGGVPGKPSFADYLTLVKSVFDKSHRLKDVQLVLEPGMSIIGASVDYYTKVVSIKRTKNNKFAVLDGSRIHIDPLMKKTSYTYHVLTEDTDQEVSDLILCGFTCMEKDRFFKYCGKTIQSDDYVIFEKVGAYTMGLSPQFIEAYPAVYVEENDEYRLVRAKQVLPIH